MLLADNHYTNDIDSEILQLVIHFDLYECPDHYYIKQLITQDDNDSRPNIDCNALQQLLTVRALLAMLDWTMACFWHVRFVYLVYMLS